MVAFFAQDEGASRFAGRAIAVAINVRRDNDSNIGTNEADLFNDCAPCYVVKRPGLELTHNGHKRLAPFSPSPVDVDEICVRDGRLRAGELMCIVMIPSGVRVGKELPNSLIFWRVLSSQIHG